MKKRNYKRELEVAKSAAIEAGKKILEIYHSEDFGVEVKADNSPLTKADKQANDIIGSILEKNFPEDSILSEESKDNLDRLNNEYCWIIDPLDGTKEFIKRNGEFTVNIALSYMKRVILGVIYVPVKEELFYASYNNGAFLMVNNEITPVRVSNSTENLRIAVSRSHITEQENKLIKKYGIQNIIKSGSSIKGCLVANDIADIYYRYGLTSEWDTAAMQCIVEEAGGIFRQMDDTQMCYNRENNLNEKGFYILNKIENKMEL